jgi:hypothetical protein
MCYYIVTEYRCGHHFTTCTPTDRDCEALPHPRQSTHQTWLSQLCNGCKIAGWMEDQERIDRALVEHEMYLRKLWEKELTDQIVRLQPGRGRWKDYSRWPAATTKEEKGEGEWEGEGSSVEMVEREREREDELERVRSLEGYESCGCRDCEDKRSIVTVDRWIDEV